MTFQLAQIDPAAFRTFDLASAYNDGQKVGNVIRDTQDDNALQQFHQMNPDATPEQTLAWAYQNMAPRNADDQLLRHKEMMAMRNDEDKAAREKAKFIQDRGEHAMALGAKIAQIWKNQGLQDDQQKLDAMHAFIAPLEKHDPEMYGMLTQNGVSIPHIEAIGNAFNVMSPAEERQAKLQGLSDEIRLKQSLDVPDANTVYSQNAQTQRTQLENQADLAKSSQPKLDAQTGALVTPSLNGQAPRIEYPLNTPQAIRDFQAYKSANSSMDNLLANINELENHPGLNSILGSIDARTPDISKNAADAEAKRQEIISKSALHTMQSLKDASSNGSTGFGALSEGELKLLQSAEANLARTQDIAQFKKQLGELKTMINNRKRQSYEGMTARYGRTAVPGFEQAVQQYPEGTVRSKSGHRQILRNGNWEDMNG